MTKRHQYLIDSYCSGTITDNEFLELEDVLRQNKDVRQVFLEYRHIDASLRTKADVAILPPKSELINQPVAKITGAWYKVLALAAAIAILLTGIALSLIQTSNGPDEKVVIDETPAIDDGKAILVKELDTVWDDVPFHEGDSIPKGILKLKSGWIELQFYSGAKVILEGPIKFEAQSENSGFLHSGRLSAKVPAHAHGFSINSADVKVIDLGTAFGMVADEREGTSVEVFEGAAVVVDLSSAKSLSDGQKLKGGEGLRVKKGKASISIAVGKSSFLTSMQLTGKIQIQQEANFKRWKQKIYEDKDDTRFLARYNFSKFIEQPGLLQNNSYEQIEGLNGTIVGAQWSEGRWPGKQALDFKRPGDCVRFNVPGSYKSVTLAGWVRLDGLDQAWSSLVLSDGWRRLGALHWQLNGAGFVELAVYVGPGKNANSRTSFKLSPSDFGRWMHLAVIYNGTDGTVTHYRNGVASKVIKLLKIVPIEIGKAQIGNWDSKEQREIRNFNGRMDDLSIYGEALSNSDIVELYQSSKP
jgi:hypothetical protein